MIRKLILLTIAILFLSPLAIQRNSIPVSNHEQVIFARKISNEGRNGYEMNEKFISFIAAWEFSSRNTAFGGFSSLIYLGKDKFLTLSDSGTLAYFDFPSDKQNIGSLKNVSIRPLKVENTGSEIKKKTDTKSMFLDKESDKLWVGLEQDHRIERFSLSHLNLEAVVRPKAMKKWPANGGAKSLVGLQDGSFLVFSEYAPGGDSGEYSALYFDKDPVAKNVHIMPFNHIPPTGYRMTDITTLPNQLLIALYRRYNPVEGASAKVAVMKYDPKRKNCFLSGFELTDIKKPLPVDNMEGITIGNVTEKKRDGKLHNIYDLWLISDDNFHSLQSTISDSIAD